MSSGHVSKPFGNYATHLALHTLKDRCRALQRRVTELERENILLRLDKAEIRPIQSTTVDTSQLRLQIIELTEMRQQLLTRIAFVCNENQNLWKQINKFDHNSVDQNLERINDSIEEQVARSTLIRSKTFTQEDCTTRLPHLIDGKTPATIDLDEISLNTDDTSNEEQTLDAFCTDMMALNANEMLQDSLNCLYEDKIIYSESTLRDLSKYSEDIVLIRQNLNQHTDHLKETAQYLQLLLDTNITASNTPKHIDRRQSTKSTSTENNCINTDQNFLSSDDPNISLPCKICPMCNESFNTNVPFEQFEEHVIGHFVEELHNV